MAKRPTINDLARASGVSVATVDRVLNRRLPVREDTAMRVVTAAEAIGYHATGLLKQRLVEIPQRTFGFLLQKRNDDFYKYLAAELTSATRAAASIRGRAVVEFMDEIVPSMIAAKINEVGMRVDALAVVAVDHPIVNEAIANIGGARQAGVYLAQRCDGARPHWLSRGRLAQSWKNGGMGHFPARQGSRKDRHSARQPSLSQPGIVGDQFSKLHARTCGPVPVA